MTKTTGYAVLLQEVMKDRKNARITLGDAANLVRISRNYPAAIDDIPAKELVSLVSHVFGEPTDLLEKMGMHVVRGRVRIFLEGVARLGMTFADAENEANEAPTDGQPLDRIMVGGHHFYAPNLDTEVMELWIALETAIEDIAAKDLTDIEALPIILGTLCREVDSQYSDNGIPARIELMRDAKYIDGIRIAAFFFGSSEGFARLASRQWPNSAIWNALKNGLALIRSGSVGVDLERSISLLISSQGSTHGSDPSGLPSST